PAPASSIKLDLPHDLETILNRCLRKDPNRRFQHMADVKIALDELKEQSDSGTLSLIVPVGSPKKRRPFGWLLGFAAVLLLTFVVIWMRFFERREPAPVMTTAPLTTYR